MNQSKILKDRDDLANPADVAKDGYDAMMNGDDKVISGLNNKLTVAMANMTTDSMAGCTGCQKCKNLSMKIKKL
jgi:short-subunit dehydrogenase